MAADGESDEAFARRLQAQEMAAMRTAATSGRAAPPTSGIPVASLAYPVQTTGTGAPVPTVAATAASASAASGGGGGGGHNFGQPTIVQVPGQPVTVLHGDGHGAYAPEAVAVRIVGPGYDDPRLGLTERLLALFHLSKTVKVFAGIDCFFVLLWGMYVPWLLIALVLPVLGYYGAKNFSPTPVGLYIAYIVLHILGRMGYVLGVELETWAVLLNLLGAMVEMWILRIVCTFFGALRATPDDELETVREASKDRW